MAANMLGFQLPWQGLQAGGNALSGLGGNPQQAMANLGPLYQQQYQAALAMNQQNNQNIQTGYGQLRDEASSIYDNIYKNMDARYGDVLGRIAGSNASNIQDINTQAAAQSGAASQQMVSRGLGNTTVQQNMQRGIALDRARAQTDSENKFAQLGAGYANQIWGDRTQAQQAKAGMMANLGTQQLGAQERIQAGYPDAGMFGSLAQMYGAQSEADKNRKMQQAAMARAGQGVQSSGGYTYSPSPWGSRNPAGAYTGGGGFDSWTSGYGGGGGGYYQGIPGGGNFTTPQNGNEWDTPYTGSFGYDPNVGTVEEAMNAAAQWGY